LKVLRRGTGNRARPGRTIGAKRSRSAALPILVAGLVGTLLTSCSGSGSVASTPTNQGEVTAITAVVTSYFRGGIGSGDWAQASRLSAGPLKTAADWLVRQGISTSEERRGSLAIHSLAVSSVSGSSASVSFDATQTGANYAVTYSGPLSMLKAPDGWKVADYLRNGRDAAAAVFPSAQGQASHSGVTVQVVGAQLEAGHVDVWVQISNGTASTLSWDQPIVIVDASGEQRGRGFLFVSSSDTGEPFVLLPRVSAFGDFLVDSVTLPLTTTGFRLLVGATDRSSRTPIDLNVPVALR